MTSIQPLAPAELPSLRGALAALPAAQLPFGYCRFVKPDRRVAAAERALEACAGGENHLLALRETGGRVTGVVAARALPWDTELFGVRMARIEALHAFGTAGFDDARAVKEALLDAVCERLRAQGAAYVYGRFPSCDVPGAHALISRGFSLMETLAVFSLLRKDADFSRVRARLPVRPAADSDVPFLAGLAEGSFREHDRFHLDPRLPRDKSDRLMRTWVEKSHRGQFDDFLLAAYQGDSPVGFMTGRKYDWDLLQYPLSHLSFSAVDPKGTGAYVSLVIGGAERLFAEGAKQIDLNTQIQNLKVIRVWEFLGFEMTDSLYTFRRWL